MAEKEQLPKTVVVVREPSGVLIPTVDGAPLAGFMALECVTNVQASHVTIVLSTAAVHFETAPNPILKKLN